MPTGELKSFNSELGFGIIEPEDSSEQLLFRISGYSAANSGTPRIDRKLGYDVRHGPEKPAAINLTLV